MWFKNSLFVFIFLHSITGIAQKCILQGTVTDSTAIGLSYVNVILENSSGSLLGFALTDDQGGFEINFDCLQNGTVLLKSSLMGYADFEEIIAPAIFKNNIINKQIVLQKQAILLNEVEVAGQKIHYTASGDTMVFNAEGAELFKGDKLIELVKQVPGVQIKSDGVYHNGEQIESIFIDGKEFFFGDVNASMETIPAEIVQNLKFYKEKNPGSGFEVSGRKALDLVLKEEFKKVAFGSVNGAYGTHKRTFDKAYANVYTTKTLFSGIGSFNNIQKPLFSQQEFLRFYLPTILENGGGQIMLDEDDAGLFMADGSYRGNKQNGHMGLDVNHTISKDKNLLLGYKYNPSSAQYLDTFLYEYPNLPDFGTQLQLSNTYNRRHAHRFNAKYKVKKQGWQYYLETLGAIYRKKGNSNVKELSNVEQLSLPFRHLSSEYEQNNSSFTARFFINKHFWKQKAAFTIQSTYSHSNFDNIQFFDWQYFLPTQEIDRENSFYKNYNIYTKTNHYAINPKIDYKLNNHWRLSWENQTSNNKQAQGNKNKTLLFSADADTVVLNNEMNLLNYTFENKLSLSFESPLKKWKLFIGSNFVQQVQKLDSQSPILSNKSTYFNIFPILNLEIGQLAGNRFNLGLSNTLSFPSLSELDPSTYVVDVNSSIKGNPNLTPRKIYNANFQYANYSPLWGLDLFAYGQAAYTKNNIIRTLDNIGQIREISYANLGNRKSASVGMKADYIVNAINTKVLGKYNFSYSKGLLSIDQIVAKNKQLNHKIDLGLEWKYKRLIRLELSTSYSISKNIVSEIDVYNYTYRSLEPKVAFELNCNNNCSFKLTYRSKYYYSSNDVSSIPNRNLLNISIEKKIWLNNTYLGLKVFDLLNDNNGFTQSFDNYINTTKNFSTLSRYIALSLRFDFLKAINK